ncbi:MAG: D-tagatose 3-epimerase, partial [Verrucomicrobiales bacterium]|nr:D-tagatose 3-epimerase [Verrucomicrobiales bacterium]
MKFAICNEIFKGWDMPRVFQFVKQCGYDGLEIAPFTIARQVTAISKETRSGLRELSAKYGLAITGIHWVLVETEGIYLTSNDPVVRSRSASYFCDLVRFCSDIGGSTIVVGSPKQRNLLPGVAYQEAWKYALETFQTSVREAEKRGVTICLEPLSPAETDFINTAEEAVQFAGELNSPAMSVILDVKAMCSEKKSIPEIITSAQGK